MFYFIVFRMGRKKVGSTVLSNVERQKRFREKYKKDLVKYDNIKQKKERVLEKVS